MSHFFRRWLALSALAPLCCAAALTSQTARAGEWWSWLDLWRTPEQQAQAMLDAGKPAQAAARFSDPRRRAYADLEAARYQQAAKLLALYTDPESEYNLGNALAESGRLPAALSAYDAALRLTPADGDIRHNRDLVELALRQQRQSGAKGSGSRQSGGRGVQSSSGARTASSSSRAGTGEPAGSSEQPNAPQASQERRAGSSREAPGEARRDARFGQSVARARRQPGHAGQVPDAGRLVAGGARTSQRKPEAERQLMLDQWLRQIPDSPAGLLQRQFLIDHMLRQQGGPADAP